jgi:hypothetical protein
MSPARIVYHLVRVSHNRKTGPIAVTSSSRNSCPDCPLKRNGCYAESQPLVFHWNALSRGERGTGLEQHCRELRALPRRSMVRFLAAGDWPGNGTDLDGARIRKIASSSRHLVGFGYTHYRGHRNVDKVARVNGRFPLTINLSANNPRDLDRFPAQVPAVSMIPEPVKVSYTPRGKRIVRCPAEYRDQVTCSNCGDGRPLCARKDRNYAIGFYPHGNAARKARAIAK